jgi:hypothetical protein
MCSWGSEEARIWAALDRFCLGAQSANVNSIYCTCQYAEEYRTCQCGPRLKGFSNGVPALDAATGEYRGFSERSRVRLELVSDSPLRERVIGIVESRVSRPESPE